MMSIVRRAHLLSAAFGLMMVAAAGFQTAGPTLVLAMFGAAMVLVGIPFRSAATVAVVSAATAIVVSDAPPMLSPGRSLPFDNEKGVLHEAPHRDSFGRLHSRGVGPRDDLERLESRLREDRCRGRLVLLRSAGRQDDLHPDGGPVASCCCSAG